ncbi:MAG: dipeptidase [Caldilineaceae bacterium]|nr:dipeptidase [Caldilineaceae bacterium]
MAKVKYPLVFDGHNDTILEVLRGRSFFEKSDTGHIDLPRAQAGGLGGGFFAVFVPNTKRMGSFPGMQRDDKGGYHIPLPDPLEHRYALDFATRALRNLFAIEAASDGKIKIVRTADELTTCLEQGIFAMLLHFEGVEALDTNLDYLHLFYQAGLRSVGITWSRPNSFGHGVPFSFPASPDIGPGLTDAGKALVKACNELGVMIDLSHLNEKGFWDVAALSSAPLVATHSNAHALAATPRNLTDKQLDAVKESNGLVGINFHIGFLREDGRSDAETSLTEIVRHAAYIADRIGIDHVTLGSDFDGATMPQDLKDAAGLPKLMKAFKEHGFDKDALQKIAHGNWVRILKQTWR